MNWTTLGVVVTGLALIVTIVIFGLESARTRGAAIEANRRALVGRVIDSVEKAARAHTRFPFGHVLNHAEFELAIAFPKLLVELNADEEPVALWVGKQVQLMQAAARAKEATTIAFAVAFKLAEWQSGRTSTSWFSDQLEDAPLDPNFRAPLRARMSRRFWFSWEVAKVTILSATTFVVLRWIVRKSEE